MKGLLVQSTFVSISVPMDAVCPHVDKRPIAEGLEHVFELLIEARLPTAVHLQASHDASILAETSENSQRGQALSQMPRSISDRLGHTAVQAKAETVKHIR